MGRAGGQRGGTTSPRAALAAASPAPGVHRSRCPGSCDGDGDRVGSQGSDTSRGDNHGAQGVGERASVTACLWPPPRSSLCGQQG